LTGIDSEGKILIKKSLMPVFYPTGTAEFLQSIIINPDDPLS
jgi:hypothetical protein